MNVIYDNQESKIVMKQAMNKNGVKENYYIVVLPIKNFLTILLFKN